MRRFLFIALALTACTAEPPPAADPSLDDTLPAPPFNIETMPPDSFAAIVPVDSLPPRAPVLNDSISIEGTGQPERLTLVRSPARFAPPFTTYLPAQMAVEFAGGDTSPSVRFVAEFGGRRNPEAYVQVKAYPAGSSELVARSWVDTYLRGRDPQQDQVRPSGGWPWTLDAYDFQYGQGPGSSGYMGTIGIVRHGNRFLHVLAHYPAEYGDGIGPRIHRILAEWRWEDNGEYLVPRRAR